MRCFCSKSLRFGHFLFTIVLPYGVLRLLVPHDVSEPFVESFLLLFEVVIFRVLSPSILLYVPRQSMFIAGVACAES